MVAELLTDAEVAARLKVSRRQVWKMRSMAQLPEPVRLGSRSVRWRASDLERFVSNGCKVEGVQ